MLSMIMIFIVATPTINKFLGPRSSIAIYQTLLSLACAHICVCAYIVKGLGTRLIRYNMLSLGHGWTCYLSFQNNPLKRQTTSSNCMLQCTESK